MNLFGWLTGLFWSDVGNAPIADGERIAKGGTNLSDASCAADTFAINPATGDDDDYKPDFNPANGLPMMGAFDIMGNPYGFDFSEDDSSPVTTSSFDDDWLSSSSSNFDSSFSDW